MELITLIIIFINAIFVYIFLDIDFITSFFVSPFISLLIFPVTIIEICIILIIYFFIKYKRYL